MTIEKVKSLVGGFLLGDNSKVSSLITTPYTFLSQSIDDVSRRCEPALLVEDWDDTVTDMFRIIPSTQDDYGVFTPQYIKQPDLSAADDLTEVPIDEELAMAVVYFLCSYFTTKENGNYEARAEDVINIYITNTIDQRNYEN